MKISIYKNIKDVVSDQQIEFDTFLDNVRDGRWQDDVLQVMSGRKAKTELPNVTISGIFNRRADTDLIQHSGLICIDVDHVDPSDVKAHVCPDNYVYAAFTSCSGKGLALVFKIKPERHRDAFNAISKYLLERYQIVTDPSCINPSRTRFVSFDPHLYENPNAKLFNEYIPKRENVEHKVTKIVFVQNDFENIIQQLQNRNIDLTYNYMDWIKIGFGIADKFGESGRSYFHKVSELSVKYDYSICDRQYSALLKSRKSGVTIATFYYLAKQQGIETYSQITNEIISKASSLKRAGKSEIDIKDQLKEYDTAIIDEIVPQVNKDSKPENFSQVELITAEIHNSYQIRRNVISRNIEIHENGQWTNMKAIHFNGIFLTIKKVFEKCSYDLIERIIISPETPEYNPLIDFLENNKHIKQSGLIKELSDCITSDYGLQGDDRMIYIAKWMVGIISAIYGKHSPLMLVLCGKKQNTGKTEFFRRLLPKEIQQYYAESKLDAGKDDEILMCMKLMIMDDEFGGKSKRELSRLKELTSKQYFSLREPYGRNNVDLLRLAVLCGTSNEDGLLSDPTGNRRIIPINVIAIDHDRYNRIDKVALLMEAYHLYHDGFKWEMNREDIQLLNENTSQFESVSIEEELVLKYFKVPEMGENDELFTTSDIVTHIDNVCHTKLYVNKVGQILSKHNIQRVTFRRNGVFQKGYRLVKLESSNIITQYLDEKEPQLINAENLPF